MSTAASNYEYEQSEGEPISTNPTLVTQAIAQLNASEIDRMIATARAFPRKLAAVRKEIYSLVVQDEETAASMIYALPRGKEKNESTGRWEQKIITGPTARFAEILAYGWGNNRSMARVISEDQEFLTAQGVFFDLEKNVSWSVEVKRRITDRDGRRFNADMVGVTANAALAIAARNAILKAIPKAVWRDLYEAAERTIKGSVETLAERRQKALDQFKVYGLTVPMICKVLGVGGVSEITLDVVGIMRGILTALKDGETTVEQLMADVGGIDAAVTDKYQQRIGEIRARYSATKQPSGVSPEVRQAQAKLAERQQRAGASKGEQRANTAPVTDAPPAPAAENPDAEPAATKVARDEGW